MKYYFEDYKQTEELHEEDLSTVSGSGGGCFPEGTLVRTPTGYKRIENILIGEPVIAYDRFGELEEGRVVQKPIHKAETYSDEIYYIYSGESSLFPQGITGNHAVYDPSTNEHKEIKDFTVGDKLVNLEGKEVEITFIKHGREEVTVYNLIVEPQHTYIAAGIRVHNGGGGKGGSARQAVEAPNTLQSEAIGKVLEIYSHGEVVGIVGGLQGVTFNNTPVQNSDGTNNFPGVTFQERKGLPTQTVVPGFENTEAEIPLAGTIVTAANPVVEQLPDSNIDAARITIRLIDGLWYQNKSNGDLQGKSVTYSVSTRSVVPSGTWSTVITKTISDKTTSPWEIAHTVEKPAGATQWAIKVTRITPDDAGANEKSLFSFARLTEIIYGTETYPNIALVGVTLPASATGNRIPQRAYQVKGIKVKVPVNYDPLLRTYSGGYWNGAFKTAWTDNPAWILYDLITNPEYGVQNFLGYTISVDIYAFFDAALYNDCTVWDGTNYIQTLIDDGQGGLEVRYRFNAVIATQQDAWQFLHAVASNMQALLVHKGDQISLLQDRPKNSIKIFNNSNVVDGKFVYSSSESSSRATAVNCTFNDKKDRYLPRTISEEDTNAINKYGYYVRDVIAYGCTSESQARRLAKWILYTETHQQDTVVFSVALNIIGVAVGDVISIVDSEYISDTNQYLTGRVKSVTGTTVKLDAPVELLPGYSYTLGVASLDYKSISEAPIVETGVITDTLTTTTALPAGDYTNHEFFCFSAGNANQEPRLFQITSITENERSLYTITGIFYDVNKFAAIEQGIVVPQQVYSNLTASVLKPVTNITFQEFFTNTGLVQENYIDVKWVWDSLELQSNGNYVDRSGEVRFNVKWRRDNGKFTLVPDVTTKSFQIPSTIPGVYEVIVSVESITGLRSLPTSATYNYRVTASNSTLIPPENFFVKGTSAVQFTGQELAITWTYPITNDDKSDALLDYVLEIYDSAGTTLKNTYVVQPNSAKGGEFIYDLTKNIADFGSASRNVQIKLYSRDTIGDLSLPVIKTFTNPVPAAVAFTVVSGTEAAYVTITPSTESDVIGYEIHRSTITGFTPNNTTLLYSGASSSGAFDGVAGTTYYYKVAAYDSFDKTSLNYSTEQNSTYLNPANVDVWTFTGLIFKPNDPAANRVSWTAGTASKNGTTPISINAGSSATAWSSGIQYFYYDGTSNTISVTTDLTIAVSGVQILATYKGGTSLTVGNGSAYIDGGLILANTVGANQLVANSAVITNTAQIANAIIGNQHIGGFIQSTNYNSATFNGWKLDKNGDFHSYGAFNLYDSAGNLVLGSNNPTIDYSKVSGTKPPSNATYGATFGSNISGQITSSNVSTYIANAAIGSAQIGNASINQAHINGAIIGSAQIQNLAVSTGHIADLSVNTIKVADGAISSTYSVNGNSLTIPAGALPTGIPVVVLVNVQINSDDVSFGELIVKENGGTIVYRRFTAYISANSYSLTIPASIQVKRTYTGGTFTYTVNGAPSSTNITVISLKK